jgi:hypothetical protein
MTETLQNVELTDVKNCAVYVSFIKSVSHRQVYNNSVVGLASFILSLPNVDNEVVAVLI